MLSKHFEELSNKSREALMASEEEVYEMVFECEIPDTGGTTVSRDYIVNPAEVMEDLEDSKRIFPKQGCTYEVELYFDPRYESMRRGEVKGIYSATLIDAGGTRLYHAVYLERLK